MEKHYRGGMEYLQVQLHFWFNDNHNVLVLQIPVPSTETPQDIPLKLNSIPLRELYSDSPHTQSSIEKAQRGD